MESNLQILQKVKSDWGLWLSLSTLYEQTVISCDLHKQKKPLRAFFKTKRQNYLALVLSKILSADAATKPL